MSTKLATILADFTTNLASALAVGATSATLQSATDDDGVALPNGTYFFTLDGENSSKEHIVCTLAGTAISGISSVSRQGVETSGVVRSHRIGATVSLTDFGHILFMNNLLRGVTAFDATAPLGYDASASITTAYQFATKEYVDGVAVAGAPNASTTVKGIVEEATQAEVRARTAAGGTAARLFINPSTMPNVLISDYVADTGAADVAVITPVPAITAYVAGQRFSFKMVATNLTTTPTVNASGLGAKTIVKRGTVALAAGDLLIGQIVEVEYDGTNMQLMSPVGVTPATAAQLKFGGTGADGALAIASGTTTIDLANAAVVIKNYTSIAITGTGALAFINPNANGTIVMLKSQGAVTLTSSATPMIDASGLGGSGGAKGTSSGGGTAGNTGNGWMIKSGLGGGGVESTGSSVAGLPTIVVTALTGVVKFPFLAPGSGGGGGASGTGDGGDGGRGGGALYIECAGAWNFTTTGGISVAGLTGNAGSANGSGGGGGGGGTFFALVGSITANSGTVTLTAGPGGAKGAGASGTASGGAGGGSIQAAGGTAAVGSGGTAGAAGATGVNLGVIVNTEYA